LGEHGIKTVAADKRVKTGLDAVAERLKVAGDGKPRLYIVRDATLGQDTRLAELRRPTSTAQEFPGYVWPETKAGRAADEMPVKSRRPRHRRLALYGHVSRRRRGANCTGN
jgi:hypothetical protein